MHLEDRIEKLEAEISELREQLNIFVKKPAGYTVNELAHELHRTPISVYRWIKHGRIAALKDPSGYWRISHEEYERYQTHGLKPPYGSKRRRGRPKRDAYYFNPDTDICD